MTQPASHEMCCFLDASLVVGIAADHGGYELKEYLIKMLREEGAVVVDYGDRLLVPNDDYPDFVVPLARAVAAGQISRGVAICGSGVGASIAANKVSGVRACLIHDPFSAHQGVEDDDLNLICLGGLVVGHALAWDLVRRFLVSQFSGKERHRRRLQKVTDLEHQPTSKSISASDQAATPNASASLKIHLFRHGETAWSLTSQHTGQTDIPLTAYGEEEARELGQTLKGTAFSHVLTSPRQRSRKTYELMNLEPNAENVGDLVEWDYGDYEGRRSVDIAKERPDWNLYRDGCPNGESPEQVSDRADRLIARLRTLDGNIALFSHGQFGGVLAARWIGLPVTAAQHFPLSPASSSLLTYDPHHREVPVIEMWNQTANPLAVLVHHPRDGVAMPLKQRELERWDNEGGEIPDKQGAGS